MQPREQNKKNKNLPFLPALSCVPRDEFLKLGVRQTTSSLRGNMRPKWRRAALWVENIQEAIRAVMLNTRAQNRPCSFFHRLHLPACSSAEWCHLLPRRTTRGFEARSHTTQPNSLWLASCSITQIRLSTNTRIMQPSSPCQGKASRNALFFQPPSPHSLLSHSFSSMCPDSDPNSLLPSDVTSINHPLQGCGLLVVIPGGGVSCPFGNVWLGCCCFKDVIPFFASLENAKT